VIGFNLPVRLTGVSRDWEWEMRSDLGLLMTLKSGTEREHELPQKIHFSAKTKNKISTKGEIQIKK
jgi:hypothetical protein